MPDGLGDAYAPAEVAARVSDACVRKTAQTAANAFALAVLAGAFIALGAAFSTAVLAGTEAGCGPARLAAGIVFSLGLILVVIAGAELFTGNNLIVMAWAAGCVSTAMLLRHWSIVLAGNALGAAGMAVLVYLSGAWEAGGAAQGAAALRIAAAKASIPFAKAFVSGLLCNVLVCLAVWLVFAARSVTDKVLAVAFPIAAFVTLGFEHSVANMYLLPMGRLLAAEPAVLTAGGWVAPPEISWAAALGNLVPVTLGNLAGGGGLVAGVYWFVYLRGKPKS